MENQRLSRSTIAIIGGGKMGEAILVGLIGAENAPQSTVSVENCVVVNPTYERRLYLQQRYGVECVEHASQLKQVHVCILAVKPQVLPSVADEIASFSWLKDCLVISIAAGITTAFLEEKLPVGTRVLRAMPNLPVVVGEGVVALCAGSKVGPESISVAKEMFAALGQCVEVEESQMDAVTALSGSGPAYVAALIEAMSAAGEELGLTAAVAEELACATVGGTGLLLQRLDTDAAQLRKDVCSPGGTTLAALDAMEQAGYSASIRAGVLAAARRSKELSG